MKYKNITFFILENIERKNIEKNLNDIKNLYLQQKKYIEELELLMNYQNEYITEFNSKLKLGIYAYQWKNYNSFIFKLRNIIQINKEIIENNEKNIKECLTQWSKNKIKLKLWGYFNKKNTTKIMKKELFQEQIINNELSQLKVLKRR